MSIASAHEDAFTQGVRFRIESPRARFVRRFRRDRLGVTALCFLIVMTIVAILAPVLAPYDPAKQVLSDRLENPSSAHLLGTDELGRDVLSRMLFAARISLLAAVQASVVSVILGVPLGLIAGYLRGAVDSILSRITEVFMATPALLFAMAIIGMLGPSVTNAMIAVGVVYAPSFFRIVRGSTLVARERTYITAAQSIGGSPLWIIRNHILPNVLPPLVVHLSLCLGFAILFEAALSFLGLGVQPPDASWGSMLGRATEYMEQRPLMVIFPGVAIILVVLAFNILGDAVNDATGRGADV